MCTSTALLLNSHFITRLCDTLSLGFLFDHQKIFTAHSASRNVSSSVLLYFDVQLMQNIQAAVLHVNKGEAPRR